MRSRPMLTELGAAAGGAGAADQRGCCSALMFFWRRGVYMFDHLIFSMHSLSFQGLLVALAMAGVAG